MSVDGGCIFCRIGAGQIAVPIIAEDEHWLAFDDRAPQAPVHALVMPRAHIVSVAAAGEQDRELLGQLLAATARVAAAKGLSERGFRVVTNSGAEAGQSVFHLHLHVLGGRPMRWPPG